MGFKPRRRLLLPMAAALALLPAIAAAPAAASGSQTVRCTGNGYFCGAVVSIAGGAGNRTVKVSLTDTDFARVAVRVTPGASRGAFRISNAGFRLGGSQYRFTLNAVRSNLRNARVILLFSAGRAAASPPRTPA